MASIDRNSTMASRRKIIIGAGAAGLGAFTELASPARGLAQTGSTSDRGAKPMASGKIDTHQHFFPKPYVDGVGLDALAQQMPNQKAPE